MDGLFEILGKIKAQPGMYLGSPSVENLFMFLVGYKTARRELGIEPTEEELKFYGAFQPWLQEKFKIRTNNSWAALIQFHSVNQKEAFDHFFSLLEEFCQSHQQQGSDSLKELETLKPK
ncbi:hypothetical protein [Leptolyngbya sp. NIES-2104]|uniref:hypothetical protein n=1 Tax=Leptolyngbya sp. NIES-2104 TaxID=1552121 RepID=UPI0006EC74EC|nr:hypothetical protein [Leptolyngbya sp. NIES-2104]GAP99418.1 hypothetical protein NIES2104_59790 [Leptolyngbya sp. NIES-2104]